jgi:TonB family protein
MSSFRLTVILIALSSATALIAQSDGVPRPSQEEIASQLFTWVPPTYPSNAQAAKVEGKVVAEIEIGPNGLVRSAKAISGPPLLRQAAVDAIKQWRYRSFHQGASSIAVIGNVEVSFSLHDRPEVHTPHEADATGTYTTTITISPPDNKGQPDEAIVIRYEPAWEICSRDVIAHTATPEAAQACKTASSIADEFPADRRFVERRRTYVYAAIAFANLRDIAAALPYAEKAVAIVKAGHDDDGGQEAAYSIRGQIRAFSGDMEGGDQDLSIAEEFARKGNKTDLLKRDLQFHAELLNRMGRQDDAKKKQEEAAKF